MPSFDIICINKRITKALISLRGCAGWSAPLWFANPMAQLVFIIGPRRDKLCLPGFWQSLTQTSLLSYREYKENWSFACSKFRHDTFQNLNIKLPISLRECVGSSAPFFVRKTRKQVFWNRGPIQPLKRQQKISISENVVCLNWPL